MAPLMSDVFSEPDGNVPQKSPSVPSSDSAAAKQNHPPSVWKPVVTRVLLSGLALVGLAGVGAASMLAGLDGARANSPRVVTPRTLPDAGGAAPVVTTSSMAPPANGAAPAASSSNAAPTQPVPACAGRTADGRVILNLATVADLRTLPGIGEKRANAILALRDKLKRFRKIQELRRVRGIGAKTMQKLAPKLLVDPPRGECAIAAQ